MLSRRQFLLATAGTFTPGLVLPSFHAQAVAYLESCGEPLLIPPAEPRHVLYATPNGEGGYCLLLDNPKLEPPQLTWREFMEHYFGSVENYLGVEEIPDTVEEIGYDLDAEADFFTVVDCWGRSESPEAHAFHLLSSLDLGVGGNHPDAAAELVFIDGPMPGSNYLGVHVPDLLSLSILQQELNRLGAAVRVEMAPDQV